MRRAIPPFILACLLLPLLVACGGGESDPPAGPQACTADEHKTWLRDYFDEWYFWTREAPSPDPAAFADAAGYFAARLHTGTAGVFPADRWSRSESTESFERFFGDGATLGWGVSVAGAEVIGRSEAPLWVRHVEPLSPAGRAGVARGDQVLALNGRPVAELIAANDFSALSADRSGQSLTLELRRDGVERALTLAAEVFSLSPVSGGSVVSSALGRRLGYVAVKDLIAQALGPLDGAFSTFRAASVQDLVLDLRYNGGGLVSTGATLASYVAGARVNGQPYVRLLYNDRRAQSNNQVFNFGQPAAALDLPRVFVLTGPRTCSAAEQVINGLRGAGVEVIAVGDTSCGKPVGFLPASACGQTYSVVNFESVNQRNEGRYFDGLAADCAVAEDFRVAQGSAGDPLLAAALQLADGGLCPPAAALRAGQRQALGAARSAGRSTLEPGERPAMLPR